MAQCILQGGPAAWVSLAYQEWNQRPTSSSSSYSSSSCFFFCFFLNIFWRGQSGSPRDKRGRSWSTWFFQWVTHLLPKIPDETYGENKNLTLSKRKPTHFQRAPFYRVPTCPQNHLPAKTQIHRHVSPKQELLPWLPNIPRGYQANDLVI